MPTDQKTSYDEVMAKVREVLVDALAVDEDQVTPGARLIADLEAESIDFLHIEFELQKAFGFKTVKGELFPDNVARNPEYVQGGKVTPAGVAMLKERLPHVDFSTLGDSPNISQVGEVFTVDAIVRFVQRKLGSA